MEWGGWLRRLFKPKPFIKTTVDDGYEPVWFLREFHRRHPELTENGSWVYDPDIPDFAISGAYLDLLEHWARNWLVHQDVLYQGSLDHPTAFICCDPGHLHYIESALPEWEPALRVMSQIKPAPEPESLGLVRTGSEWHHPLWTPLDALVAIGGYAFRDGAGPSESRKVVLHQASGTGFDGVPLFVSDDLGKEQPFRWVLGRLARGTHDAPFVAESRLDDEPFPDFRIISNGPGEIRLRAQSEDAQYLLTLPDWFGVPERYLTMAWDAATLAVGRASSPPGSAPRP